MSGFTKPHMRCICCTVVLLIICMIVYFRNVNYEAYLQFIHIPKTGGTTIENVAYENGVRWGRFMKNELSDASRDYPSCKSEWHVPPKYLNQDSPYSKNETFCVIRDPLERVVSEYAWRFQFQKEVSESDYFTADRLNAWIAHNINHEYYLTGDEDCHHLPQYDYVYDDHGNITCNNPLDFAYLTQSFNTLIDKHQLKSIQLSSTRVDNKSINRLSVNDISNENLVNLKRIYQKDIELYDRIHKQHTSVFQSQAL